MTRKAKLFGVSGRRRAPARRLSLTTLEDRSVPASTILNGTGLGIAGDLSGGNPPDVSGAAGPSSYIEATNRNVQIYNKATGALLVSKADLNFFFGTSPGDGNLTRIDATSQRIADMTMLYDDLIGRFIVGNIDVNQNTNVSQFVFAVSKTSNPATLSTADWNFYQITTTENPGPNSTFTDYPGNPGYNADAVVVTFNMAKGGFLTNDTQIVSINAADLANGVAQGSLNFFRNDIAGTRSYRPVSMHDSVAGDPMWLVRNPDDGSNINVTRMTNVLSNAAGFATTSLALPAADNFPTGDIAPKNANGSSINDIDTRILKAGEFNNTIAAVHKIKVSGTEADVQWYAIDVSGATPAFQLTGGVENIGRIGFGGKTYAYDPGIDINSRGDIGLSFIESDQNGGSADASTGGNPSMFVAARTAGDAAGAMEGTILVSAGKGAGKIAARSGDFSGMNVDPVDGTFWGVNEFGQLAGGVPGTAVANFTPAVSLDATHEDVTIRLDPLDPTTIQVLAGAAAGPGLTPGALLATYPNNLPDLIFVAGDVKNNTVVIDQTYGVVSAPVRFLGGGSTGAPDDQLTVFGTGGNDILNLTPSAATAARVAFDPAAIPNAVYSFANIQKFTFDGEAGTDAMNVDNTTSALSLSGGVTYDGGGPTNTLSFTQGTNAWKVTGGDSGTVNTSLTFANVQNLTGGSGKDTFTIAGGTLAGTIAGGGGYDTADLTALTAQQVKVKQLGATDGFDLTGVPAVAGDLLDMNNLIASGAAGDKLTGMDGTATWTVNAPNAGQYVDVTSARTLDFSKVENLTGGTSADTLVLTGPAGTLSGQFDGGGGGAIDTVDLHNLLLRQAVTLTGVSADGFNSTGGTNVTGGFLDIDRLIAGKAASPVVGASDRLTGLAGADANWLVKAGIDASYYQDVASGQKLLFANFEELYGGAGTGADAMTVDFTGMGNTSPVPLTGLTTDGQGGTNDSLSVIGRTTSTGFVLGQFLLTANGFIVRYNNFETLAMTGGAGNDSLYAPYNVLQGQLRYVSFNAGGGNDVATVTPTYLGVLHLDGGAGTNILTVLNTGQLYLTPLPPKSAVSGIYYFANRQRIEFLNWQIRSIGITQPQP